MRKCFTIKPITVVEMVLSYISLGWAYVLFTTPDLFNTNASFAQIAMIANYEWVVGIIALFCALVKIIGMILGNIRMRNIGLLMSTVFWILIATSMLVAAGEFNVSTGFVCYSGLAVMSLWTSKEVVSHDRIK